MNKVFIYILLSVTMFKCMPHRQTINSKDLIGKYELDIPSTLHALDTNASKYDVLFLGLGGLELFGSDLTIQFEEKKILFDGSGWLFEFLWMIDETNPTRPIVYDYKIKKNSLLYVRKSPEEQFEHIATLRKVSDSYDYLQYVIESEDSSETYVFYLRKMQAE